jgi:GxxExxY protein
MIGNDGEEALMFSAVGSFYEVYNHLGFGFLERHYLDAFEWEMREKGHSVIREVGLQVRYKHLDLGFMRLDMIVDDRLIIEAKSTEILPSYSSRQIYNYLRASRLEIGLLLHFGPKPYFDRVFCRFAHKSIPMIGNSSDDEEHRPGNEPIEGIRPP